MDYGGACCYIGYTNLMRAEPELIQYLAKLPGGSNLFMNFNTISPCIASDDEIELKMSLQEFAKFSYKYVGIEDFEVSRLHTTEENGTSNARSKKLGGIPRHNRRL